MTKKSSRQEIVHEHATWRAIDPPQSSMSRSFVRLSEICQIVFLFYKEFSARGVSSSDLPLRCADLLRRSFAPAAADFIFILSSLPPPQSFPVALELRRVGVGHRPRIMVGADATELQGPWSALEPRPRLSSLSPLPVCVSRYGFTHTRSRRANKRERR